MSTFGSEFELSSLNGTNGFQISGEAANDFSGNSVSAAGDVNGDGFDDLIIGASGADPNGNYSGASYVVFGKSSGFSATLNLSMLDGSNGFQISGEAIQDVSGGSVSGAGDVNGDGFDDLIIGAQGPDQNGENSGASYVVFGKAGGFSSNLNLSDLDGTNGFQISGEAANDLSGNSVSAAGDVNGDGFDDLVIGAYRDDPNGYSSGASYVIFGQAGGFSANLDLSTLDGANGFQISGEAAGDRLGRSVSAAGDVNGDGFDDLIIGAYWADPNGAYSGASYVVFGKVGGFSANLDLSTLDGANGFQISGEAADDLSGVSVSDAGDVNGDGFDDLIIGAPRVDQNGASSGASYVVFGKAGGFSSNLNLSDLDGTNGFQISGEAAIDFSGNSVSAAGDVNGDGFDDLIIGAYTASPNGNPSGASYVVFGQAGGFSANLDLSTLDGANGFQISGEAAGDLLGRSVSAAGDVNGDGFDDLIVGAAQADANGSASGASYVIFGGPNVPNFQLLTDSSQIGIDIDPNSLIDIDRIEYESSVPGDPIRDSSAIYIGGGIILTAAHVPYEVINDSAPPSGEFRSQSVYQFDFGEGLTDIDGLSISIHGDSADERFLNEEDRFTNLGSGPQAVDVAMVDLSEGGAISSSDAQYLESITAAGMVVFVNPEDAVGLAMTLFGYPAASQNGQTLAQSEGAITGYHEYPVDLQGTTYEGYTASIPTEGGFSGGPAYLELDKDGDGVSKPYLVGVLSAGSGGVDGPIAYIAPISGVYGELAADLDQNHSADDFPRQLIIGDQRMGGVILAGFFHEDIYGSSFSDVISALGGNDSVSGDGGNDSLYGGDGNDRLDGGGENDLLDGGAGIDTLIGGIGNDTYIVNGGDTITENSGQGTDTVQSSASITLGANLENLVLTGSGAINGTGNTLNNRLTGNSANNVLNGAGGNDALLGGAGNDTYIVNGGDTVSENASQGTDTVQASVSFTLGANLEKLTLTGSSGISGTGNTLSNTIVGNGGNNTLNGSTGNDTLTGSSGSDTFVFNTSVGSSNVDRITDFNVAADTIRLENAIFTGLAGGTLSASAFVRNTSGNAADASDRIIYESDTGKLYFDRDGTGGAAKVQFATLGTNLAMTNADFFVF